MDYEILLKIFSYVITASGGIVSTLLAVKYNRRANINFQKGLNILKPVASDRMVSSNVDIKNPAQVFKTRKFDNVVAPHSGTVTNNGSVMFVENEEFKTTLDGVMSLISDNIVVQQGERIAVVNKSENDEGRLIWVLENKKSGHQTNPVQNNNNNSHV